MKPQPPRKKRPHKPKRHQKKQKQIHRDISFLPTYTELIMGELSQIEEQYASFAAAKHKPHVLDDAIVDLGISYHPV
jgi:hypothetical protein